VLRCALSGFWQRNREAATDREFGRSFAPRLMRWVRGDIGYRCPTEGSLSCCHCIIEFLVQRAKVLSVSSEPQRTRQNAAHRIDSFKHIEDCQG
jgi:hypothetical protein